MGADFGPVLDWVQQRTAAGMFPTAVVGIATSQGTVDLGAFGTTGGRAVRSDDAVGWGWEEQLADLSAAVGADFTFDEAADPVPLVPLPGFDAVRFAAVRHPGADAIARAEDLLALGSSLLAGDGRAVRPATLEMMCRPLTQGVPRLDRLATWDGQEYGVAFNLRFWQQGLIDQHVFGHSGWAGTEFWIHPELDLCWTLLTTTPDRPGFELDALDNLIVSCAS